MIFPKVGGVVFQAVFFVFEYSRVWFFAKSFVADAQAAKEEKSLRDRSAATSQGAQSTSSRRARRKRRIRIRQRLIRQHIRKDNGEAAVRKSRVGFARSASSSSARKRRRTSHPGPPRPRTTSSSVAHVPCHVGMGEIYMTEQPYMATSPLRRYQALPWLTGSVFWTVQPYMSAWLTGSVFWTVQPYMSAWLTGSLFWTVQPYMSASLTGRMGVWETILAIGLKLENLCVLVSK
ncbi:hypothetical protein JOL62DRAFT_317397 [Phyllosticta paracitricarpa]|uniref:Uncharacterized protein n=2 Tax=Phyllosticta TaxID=121621 RepID=A0ABR1L5H6_9PEZI